MRNQFVAWLVLAVVFLACGGGGGKAADTGADIPATDPGYTDGEVAPDTPQEVTGQKKILFADGTKDDVDKNQCTPDKVCNIMMLGTQKRDLKLKVVDGNNQPVEGETLVFTVEGKDAADIGNVTQEMSATGAGGIATNSVTSKQKDGEIKIKVCSTDQAVACVAYKVVVNLKDQPPLIVRFAAYSGSFPQLNKVAIRVFKKEVAKCADLSVQKVNDLSSTTGKEVAIDETAFFSELNVLLEPQPDKTFEFTVFAMGSIGEGAVVATACDDTKATFKYKDPTVVLEMTLEDLIPSVAKTYKVYNQFNLVEGLPEDVKKVVDTIIGFFTDPAGQALLLFCDAGFAQNNDTLKSFCGFIFNNKEKPDLKDKTTVGQIVSDILNAVILAVIDKYCPYKDNPDLCKDIAYMGKEVSKMLTEFRVISTLTFKQEPDASGNIPADKTEEIWRTVVVKWSYGQNCPPDDDNCGLMNLEFSAIPGVDSVVSSKFDAVVTKPTKNGPATMTIKTHGLNLKYGALMNYALEKLVLPKLFGPKVESYEALLGSLLGGQQCLEEDDCCTEFANSVTSQTSTVTKALLEGACKALVDVGSKYLRDKLLGLDVATGENFTLGTKEPCPLYDESTPPDMVIDKLGKKDKPCVWDAQLKIGGQSFPPSGTFYGKVE